MADRPAAESETQQLASIVKSLQVRMGDGLDAAVIEAEVEAELAAYSAARVTQFVPVLVESRVRERLRRRPFPSETSRS